MFHKLTNVFCFFLILFIYVLFCLLTYLSRKFLTCKHFACNLPSGNKQWGCGPPGKFLQPFFFFVKVFRCLMACTIQYFRHASCFKHRALSLPLCKKKTRDSAWTRVLSFEVLVFPVIILHFSPSGFRHCCNVSMQLQQDTLQWNYCQAIFFMPFISRQTKMHQNLNWKDLLSVQIIESNLLWPFMLSKLMITWK